MFLPGQDDIEALQQLLEEHLPHACVQRQRRLQNEAGMEGASGEQTSLTSIPTQIEGSGLKIDFQIRPLYAALPPDEQLKAFALPEPGVRKFVLATNIAETSVTIAGVKYGEVIY